MKEQRYAMLVKKAKKDTESQMRLLNQMKPLINMYSKKLFFLDSEDATQEICLAIIEAIINITECETDGQCITYINNAVKYRFARLCKRNIKKEKMEETYELNLKLAIYNEKYGDIETIYDWTDKIKKLSNKQKKIFNYLIEGYTDYEIAKKMGMSRQYINRVKKQFCLYF